MGVNALQCSAPSQLTLEKLTNENQSDQDRNWKKMREARDKDLETIAEQKKMIAHLESKNEKLTREKSRSESQKIAEKNAIDALTQLLESPQQPLRLEAAKLLLDYSSKM